MAAENNFEVTELESHQSWIVDLIARPAWIKRRVESIGIHSDGETRRKISFDFRLPSRSIDSLQALNAFRDPEQKESLEMPRGKEIAIPLCFMQKTTLVDLDVNASDGRSLPVATTDENANLVLNAFSYLIRHISPDQSPSDSDDGIDPILVCKSVVMSRRYVKWDDPKESLKSFSPDYLELSESYLKNVIDQLDRGEYAGDLCTHFEAQTEKLNEKGAAKELTAFVTRLVNRSKESAGGEKERIETQVRFLLILLATMVRNYMFVVLIDRSEAEKRSIIKVSYLSQLVISSGPVQRFLCASESLDILVAANFAESTHLEIEALNTMQIVSIEEVESGREEDSKNVAKPEDSKNVAKPVFGTPHQVHLQVKNSEPPSIKLRITLTPSASGPVLWALYLSLFSWVGQIGMYCLFQFIHDRTVGITELSERAEYFGPFRDTNALTLATLIVSVTLAAAVVNHLHDLDRRLAFPSRFATVASAVLFSLSMLIYSRSITYAVSDSGSELTSVESRFLVLMASLTLIISLWSAWNWFGKRRPPVQEKLAKPVPVISAKTNRDRRLAGQENIASESSYVASIKESKFLISLDSQGKASQ